MQSSFCQYEKREECELLKKKCVPGQKGCVIVKAGYKIDGFKSKYGDINIKVRNKKERG